MLSVIKYSLCMIYYDTSPVTVIQSNFDIGENVYDKVVIKNPKKSKDFYGLRIST